MNFNFTPRPLSLSSDAESAFEAIADDVCNALLAETELIVRLRGGNTIEKADVSKAQKRVFGGGTVYDVCVLLAGVFLGAGVAGLAQTLLDGKDWKYIMAFSVLSVLGLGFALASLRRKWKF